MDQRSDGTVKPLEPALNRVREHADRGMAYGLAVYKAAQETGVSVADVTAELSRRRAASRAAKAKRDAYRCALKY